MYVIYYVTKTMGDRLKFWKKKINVNRVTKILSYVSYNRQ